MPGYQPSAEAFAPALQIVDLLRGALADATARSQIHPDAATDPGMELLSTMHFGVISQHLANDAGRDWDHSRYTRHHREILCLFIKAYPPPDMTGAGAAWPGKYSLRRPGCSVGSRGRRGKRAPRALARAGIVPAARCRGPRIRP